MKHLMLCFVFLLCFFYLYLTYAGFYDFIGKINLKTPYTQVPIILENSQGTAQGTGQVKYTALGDSLTAGVGSTNVNDTFAYQYALKLSAKSEKVSLYNLAQPGGTTVNVIKDQLPATLEIKPDYVTLLIGTNDIHNKRFIKDFRENYTYILSELLTKTNAHITVMTIPYLGSPKLVHPPFDYLLDFRTKQFNKVISEVVANVNSSERVKLTDLYTQSNETSKQNTNYYSSDLFHPSNEGYLLWGKIINAN